MAKCDICEEDKPTIRFVDKLWICPECGNYTPNPLKDGYLTRNSFRMDRERDNHKADMVQPHVYDKVEHKMKLNPEFVRLYPDKVRTYATKEEMREQKLDKLATYSEALDKTEKQLKEKRKIEYAGSETKAFKKVAKNVRKRNTLATH